MSVLAYRGIFQNRGVPLKYGAKLKGETKLYIDLYIHLIYTYYSNTFKILIICKTKIILWNGKTKRIFNIFKTFYFGVFVETFLYIIWISENRYMMKFKPCDRPTRCTSAPASDCAYYIKFYENHKKAWNMSKYMVQ